MNKKFIVFLLVFIVCLGCAFAREWAFSLTAGYDHQSCKDRDNSSNAIGVGIGARSAFNQYLDFYADASAHFAGSFKRYKEKYNDSKLGFKTHLGLIYKIPSNSSLSFGIGAGVALARSVGSTGSGDAKLEVGFTNMGLAVFGTADFKLSEKFAFIGQINPDIYFVNWDTEKKNNVTTTTRLSKLGFGLSIKVGVAYYL